jgi:hypothetical protein
VELAVFIRLDKIVDDSNELKEKIFPQGSNLVTGDRTILKKQVIWLSGLDITI